MTDNGIAKPTGSASLIYHFVKDVFPQVKHELSHWYRLAAQAEPHLAEQARASITSKGFHCQGGSIYALYPGADTKAVVEFVVAYQTISDYLDNLVDSLDVHDEQAFTQLHLAMVEALEPGITLSDYYRYYPYKLDGGYLKSLVQTCQARVSVLPVYSRVKQQMLWHADLYSKLQAYKHLSLETREAKLLGWITPHLADYPEISPWEFAAATGSTLGIFCLFAAAHNSELSEINCAEIFTAYFPWICGLHILLDYFIDLSEDLRTNQLNFVQYYNSTGQAQARLSTFIHRSLEEAGRLPFPDFHGAVVRGLLAMYLSDIKGSEPEIRGVTARLIAEGGLGTKALHFICGVLRKIGKI